jgi:hypothetical protein
MIFKKLIFLLFVSWFFYYEITKYMNCPNHNVPTYNFNDLASWRKYRYERFCFKPPLVFYLFMIAYLYIFYYIYKTLI